MHQLKVLSEFYSKELGVPPLEPVLDVWPQFAHRLFTMEKFGIIHNCNRLEVKAKADLYRRWADGIKPADYEFVTARLKLHSAPDADDRNWVLATSYLAAARQADPVLNEQHAAWGAGMAASAWSTRTGAGWMRMQCLEAQFAALQSLCRPAPPPSLDF
jgi:hypothetical protein